MFGSAGGRRTVYFFRHCPIILPLQSVFGEVGSDKVATMFLPSSVGVIVERRRKPIEPWRLLKWYHSMGTHSPLPGEVEDSLVPPFSLWSKPDMVPLEVLRMGLMLELL